MEKTKGCVKQNFLVYMALSKVSSWTCSPVLPAKRPPVPHLLRVETLSGERFTVEVREGESVYGLKALIGERLGIAPQHERLLFRGVPINDDWCLKDCHVANNSTILMVRRSKTYEVRIKNCDNAENISCTVCSSNTVRDLKLNVLRKEGIPMHKQQLSFSGHILNDEKPLSFYYITGASLIELRVVHFSSGKIFVKTPSGQSVGLAVNGADTVQSVKCKLAEREGIAVEEQRLLFGGKQLEAGRTLSEYGVNNDSTLDLSLPLRGGMQIYIRVTSSTAPHVTLAKLVVDASDTVESVKEKSINALGNRVDNGSLQLYHDGKFLEDGKSLQMYDIDGEAVLDLVFPVDEYIRVIVETDINTCIPMIVKSSDTIMSLKLKLRQRNGISPEHQQIIVPGKRFPEDEMTLKQGGIVNNSVVYQVYRFSSTVQIFVRSLAGKTMCVSVNELNTTWDLQALICRAQDIPPSAQRLIYSSKQLEYGKTLKCYSIKEHSSMQLANRMRGMTIFVKSPTMIKRVVVESSSTIRDVRNKLEKDFSSLPKSCLLVYERTELEDSKTLNDYEVPPESVLHLLPAVCLTTGTAEVQPLIEIHYNDHIHSIISRIKNQLGISVPPEACLSVDGEPLSNLKPLHDIILEVEVNLTLHSSPIPSAPVQLTVSSSRGSTLLTAYSSSSTVKALKRMINRERGIPCELQRIFHRGKELDDSNSLAYYDIVSGSVLDLIGDNTNVESCELEQMQTARLEAERALAQEQNLHQCAERRAEEARIAMQKMREANIQEQRRAAEREEELQTQLVDAQEVAENRAEEARIALQRMREAQAEREQELQRELHDAREALQRGVVPTPGQPLTDITPWKISRNDVRLMGEIGVGAWGTVARGMYNGQQVAVKYPHQLILNEDTLRRLERETELMTQVRHPNLIRIIAAVFDEHSFRLHAPPMIITEICDLNLRQCYEQRRLADTDNLPIFKDVAYGLHYLHDRHNQSSTEILVLQMSFSRPFPMGPSLQKSLTLALLTWPGSPEQQAKEPSSTLPQSPSPRLTRQPNASSIQLKLTSTAMESYYVR